MGTKLPDCPRCNHAPYPTVDRCEECREPFGLSGEDENGFNCTCTACGVSNTYYESCGSCGEELPVEMWK